MSEDRPSLKGWSRLAPPGAGSDRARAPAPAPPNRAPHPRGTFISNGAVFDGTLTLRGDFRLDTEYRGTLETDGRITIGPNGSVVGDLRAREVVIQGAVVGAVIAPRQLVIESTGKLHGDIETACLEIQKHAFFKGSTMMTQPIVSARPTPEPAPTAGTPSPQP